MFREFVHAKVHILALPLHWVSTNFQNSPGSPSSQLDDLSWTFGEFQETHQCIPVTVVLLEIIQVRMKA